MKKFTASYSFGKQRFCVEFQASCWEEAEEKTKAIKNTLILDGEEKETLEGGDSFAVKV